MRTNRYTHFVPYKDSMIVFNGLTEASFQVSAKNASVIRDVIERPDLYADAYGPFLARMVREGFVVDNDFDEWKEVVVKSDALRRPEEYMIMILPTYQCNLRCWYCVQKHADLWLAPEVIERIKSLIQSKLAEESIRKLSLSWFGGEPLLAYGQVLEISRWAKAAAAAAGKSYAASITTNATLLTPERIEELRDAGMVHYQITIDGDSDTHNKIKVLGKKSAYATTMANIAKIIEHTPVMLRFNYTKDNMKPESIIADLDATLPKEHRHMVTFTIFKVWQEAEDAVPAHVVEKLAEMAKSIGLRPRFADAGMCYADQLNFDCVFPNGNVGKCDNHNPEMVGGRISDSGKVEWSGTNEAFTPTVGLEKSECVKCKYLPICWGPCVSKREKMLKERGGVHCQFADRDSFMANMIRNKHINKMAIMQMAESGS